MKLLEKIGNLLEWIHVRLARGLTRFFGAIWRVQSKIPLSLRFTLGFVLLALGLLGLARLMDGGWVAWAQLDETFIRYLENDEIRHLSYARTLRYAALGAAGLSGLAALLALVRFPPFFRLMQVAWAAAVTVGFLVFRWTISAADIINLADNKAFDSVMRNNLWAASVFAGLAALIVPAILLVALLAKGARRHYRLKVAADGRDLGGAIVASLRTGGADRRWRSSLYWAITLFLIVLVAPYLVISWGWEEPYGLPAGGGEQVIQVVKVKKHKPKKKKKKLTVNPWSPYILERMDIDDVQTLAELENESRDTYQATQAQAGGKGKGVGGWPKGMEGAAVRFIRLKYRGGDWDQDMGRGADYNLLIKFHEWTGIKIARDTEFREIERLKHFPKKKAPPFVFMTGRGNINVSDAEVKALRDYCLVEGGMLFIDNGGGHFDSSVKNLLRRVFPGRPLVDVSNDDPIYQRPYVFPDGAPAFWHHGGYRGLGIREEGRWLVYYHPGDINDAWRDDHSGASAEVADQAYKLGVNVMFYAFNQYYRRHYEQD